MRNNSKAVKTFFAFAMVVGLMNTFASTAHADEWQDHQRDAREWRHHHHHHPMGPGRPVVYEQPNVVYAPPVVVEAPQAADSGFNITIPLNFK
jgi:hypothetical protein